jgi:hypothetical protein
LQITLHEGSPIGVRGVSAVDPTHFGDQADDTRVILYFARMLRVMSS